MAYRPYTVPELEGRFPASLQLGESFPLQLLTGVKVHRLALRFGSIIPSVVIGRHGYFPRAFRVVGWLPLLESTAVRRDGA